MKKLFILSNDKSACFQYRIEVYKQIKSTDIEFIISDSLKDFWYDDDKQCHAVLLQRPTHPDILPFVRELKQEGTPIVVETDDLLEQIPYFSPAFREVGKDRIDTYLECIRLADAIHVSTNALAKHYGKKSVVFENALDLKKYEVLPEKIRTNSVGWFGSNTHKESLDIIKPLIKELERREIVVNLMGDIDWLRSMFTPSQYINLIPSCPLDKYYMMPAVPDVFLTPLPDTQFANCKSNLKILEAGIHGVPVVSSDVIPFREFHQRTGGGNILVKKNRLKNWLDPVLKLLNEPEYWDHMSGKIKDAVKKHYNVDNVNNKRVEWWSQLLYKDKRQPLQ